MKEKEKVFRRQEESKLKRRKEEEKKSLENRERGISDSNLVEPNKIPDVEDFLKMVADIAVDSDGNVNPLLTAILGDESKQIADNKSKEENKEENKPKEEKKSNKRIRVRVDVLGQRPMIIDEKPRKIKHSVCQRCHILRHYNRVLPIHIPIQKFKLMLKNLISGKNLLVLKIVDIFDFNGSFIPDFHDIVGENPVVLLANKSDILPKGFSAERIINWLRRASKEIGLSVKSVYLISAMNGTGVQKLLEDLPTLREGRDIYVLGTSNTGKSTFINQIMSTLNKGKKKTKRCNDFTCSRNYTFHNRISSRQRIFV